MYFFRILMIDLLIIFCGFFSAYAFTFDIWQSGMTKDQVFEIGNNKNITFRDGGRSYGKHMIMLNKIQYNDTLLGEKATINLVFTKQTNILSKISIRWADLITRNRADDLFATLRIELPKKYGVFKRKTKTSFSISNGHKCTGKTDSYTFNDALDYINIYYTRCNKSVTLNYKDKQIESIYDSELSRVKFKQSLSLEKF